MTLSIKPGVELSDLDLTMADAIPLIARVFDAFGYKATITSARDGKHMTGSLHYEGKALDWRTWSDDHGTQMRDGIKKQICDEIMRDCPWIQAIPEATHIHTEFDDG
jgi:hypothetical protein